jgi:hypothetical protein
MLKWADLDLDDAVRADDRTAVVRANTAKLTRQAARFPARSEAS